MTIGVSFEIIDQSQILIEWQIVQIDYGNVCDPMTAINWPQ